MSANTKANLQAWAMVIGFTLMLGLVGGTLGGV